MHKTDDRQLTLSLEGGLKPVRRRTVSDDQVDDSILEHGLDLRRHILQ
jgi:hypothetical protein